MSSAHSLLFLDDYEDDKNLDGDMSPSTLSQPSTLFKVFENSNDLISSDTITIADQTCELNKSSSFYLPMNKSFAERLLRLQYIAKQMQYQFAYFNTIGGAYHLCDQPEQALRIARQQEVLAYHFGSMSLLLRAKGFQAINVGLMGNYRQAFYRLKNLIRIASEKELIDIVNFLQAILLWLKHKRVASHPDAAVLNTVPLEQMTICDN